MHRAICVSSKELEATTYKCGCNDHHPNNDNEMTATAEQMTVAELLAQAAAAGQLKPSNGDRAYTRYRGVTFEGTLAELGTAGFHGLNGKLEYNANMYRGLYFHGTQENPGYYLYVGYDEQIEWDAEKGMWYAPADYD